MSINPPFYAMQSLLIPFDTVTGDMIISHMFLNICLTVGFMTFINKYVDEQFEIMDYVMIRTSAKNMLIKYSSYVYKKMAFLLVIKTLSDILFAQTDGLYNVDIFLWLSLSTIITIGIWSELFILLKLRMLSSKVIYLCLLAILFLAQLFCHNITISCIVIGSFNLLDQPIILIGLKTLLWFTLFTGKLYFFRIYESLGVKE